MKPVSSWMSASRRYRVAMRLAAACPSAAFALSFAHPANAAGDPENGANVFRQCMACHSAVPGEHLTGPSLAHVWKRKAGTAAGFDRYSDPLKRSGIVWDESTLDRWLADPEAFVHGTSMTFPGVKDERARHDVIGYLHELSERAQAPTQGGGMMGGGRKPDLRRAPPEGQVRAITHCGDAYTIETADGKRNKVWEFNLRFKTDSSKLGPFPGKPVVLGAGMQGDRASVIFASPSEISGFIQQKCD